MQADRDRLAPRELRALFAVVDGALPAPERAAAEARLTATPEGRRALFAHRRVAGALRAHGPTAPASLRLRIDTTATQPRSRAWSAALRPALAFGGGLAALAVLLIVAFAAIQPSGPSVAQAAALSHEPATAPTPLAADERSALLDRGLDGLAFPDWGEELGWEAKGARGDELAGRRAETVFYEHEGHRISYTIVAGKPLPVPDDARRSRVGGLEVAAYRDGQHDVLVFERNGHTCVLAGHVRHADTLVKLAAWDGGGAVSF